MSNPIVHFEVMGPDAVALQKFYAEMFGWRVGEPGPAQVGFYGLVDAASSGLAGGIGQSPEGGSRVTLYMQVPDLQAALDKAVSKGGQLAMPPTEIPGAGVTLAMFRDPAGNFVGLLKG